MFWYPKHTLLQPQTQHTLSITSNLGLTQQIALHNDLILLASLLPSLTNDKIHMMTTNVSLSRTPARWGFLLSELGPIYIVSFYLITRYNSLIITEGWVYGASTSVFLSRYHLQKDCQPRLKRIPLLMRWDYPPLNMNPEFSSLRIWDYYYYYYLLLLLLLLLLSSPLLLLLLLLSSSLLKLLSLLSLLLLLLLFLILLLHYYCYHCH